MNKYDLNHICTTHPKMSREEWDRAYKMAWQRYYTIDHVETILRRVAQTRANASNALFLITWFMGSINIEHIHPLESGLLRLKYRRDRRPGFPIEPIWSFYPKYLAEMASKVVRWGALYLRLRRIYLRIKHDPQRYAYTDMAMTPSPPTRPRRTNCSAPTQRAPSSRTPSASKMRRTATRTKW